MSYTLKFEIYRGRDCISMRLYYNYKQVQMQTDVCVTPKYWDQEKQRVKKNHTNSINLNSELDRIRKKVDGYFWKCKREETPFDVFECRDYLKGVQKMEFIGFVEQMRGKWENLADNTLQTHDTLIKYLKQWKKTIPFHTVDYRFVDSFFRWMGMQEGRTGELLSTNYRNTLLRTLKKYTTKAIRFKYLDVDPFLDYRIRNEKKENVFLSPEEIKRFRRVVWNTKSPSLDRERYIFSTYTALAFADSGMITPDNFIETTEGLLLAGKRKKTDQRFMVPLWFVFDGEPERMAWKLIEGKRKGETIFSPDRDLSSYHKTIRSIAKIAGIEKHISSHTARHTFAALHHGKIPEELLRFMMGHAPASQTSRYGGTTEKMFVELIRKIS